MLVIVHVLLSELQLEKSQSRLIVPPPNVGIVVCRLPLGIAYILILPPVPLLVGLALSDDIANGKLDVNVIV
jgi:hypothetical protein